MIEYDKEVDALRECSKAYYSGEPIISDSEFDSRVIELRKVEEELGVPPSDVIGSIIDDHKDGFAKERHGTLMYSMSDIFNKEEASSWMDNVNANEYVIEPKYDGLSLDLRYEKGKLVVAITRGDGTHGDVVTNNAKTVHGIPHKISHRGTIEIRGEIVMSKTTLKELNSERKINGKNLLSNTRNAAVGALKSKSPITTASRRLEFYPWGLGSTKMRFKTQSQALSWISTLGFKEPLFKAVVKTKEDVLSFYDKMTNDRSKLDIDIDGLAIKVNDLAQWDKLGVVDKYPKYSFAFKFPHKEYVTKLKDVVFQIGKTGTVTPVAILEPVNIDGVTVSRATLHNREEIERLGIMIGDRIVIVRSGEVIPKIKRVVKESRTGNEIRINFPLSCPTCESDLENDTCINRNCPDIIKNKLLHFASRERFNITGLGEAIIETLIANSLLDSYRSIFELTEEDLVKVNIGAPKKLLDNIALSKSVTLDRLIGAIGIPNVGKRAGKAIGDRFGLNFLSATVKDLSEIPGIGDVMARDFVRYMDENRDEVMSLLSVINPILPDSKAINDSFKNITVVITGTLALPRSEIIKYIEDRGGKVTSSISSKVTALLYNSENAGSKLDKAKKCGVTLVEAGDASSGQLLDIIDTISDLPF